MGTDYKKLREECCAANQSLNEFGLVDLTFGNVSVADRTEGILAIKPSGVDYFQLKPEDIVILRIAGGPATEVVDGSLRPSSDTPTHRCLYQAFEGVGSIVHTHSRSAVAFAQACSPIPCLGTTHADYFNGSVPVTRPVSQEEIDSDYEWNCGRVIAKTFEGTDPLTVPGVLLRNHGPFAWGGSSEKAVEAAYALELVAELALKTLQIDPKATPIDDVLLRKHFLRKHGKDAYYGQK